MFSHDPMPDLFFFFRRLHLHKKRSEVKQPFAQLAGVSLLKPLKGVDPNLMSNLETFFTLDYPKVTPRCRKTEPLSAPSCDSCSRLMGFGCEVIGIALFCSTRSCCVFRIKMIQPSTSVKSCWQNIPAWMPVCSSVRFPPGCVDALPLGRRFSESLFCGCRGQKSGNQPQDQQSDARLRGSQIQPGVDLRQRHQRSVSPAASAAFSAFRVLMLTLRSVKPDTLTDMTNQMTDKVGLVHGLPYVADRQGFAATLEQVRRMHRWTFLPRWHLRGAARYRGLPARRCISARPTRGPTSLQTLRGSSA